MLIRSGGRSLLEIFVPSIQEVFREKEKPFISRMTGSTVANAGEVAPAEGQGAGPARGDGACLQCLRCRPKPEPEFPP